MRKATPTDLPLLVELMAEFYAEGGYTLNQSHATKAFASLLADQRVGLVWLIETPTQPTAVGYLVLSFCFSMEYGGMKAILDDLFVRIDYRNRGLSSQSLAELRAYCQQAGIRSLSVEVGPANGPAQRVYRRTGFVDVPNRQWLSLPLATATHEP
ncbi:GNAT family N-acetyltransferase [Spirosoma luteum]|uniref:GNAT family N-acetyltransferase n=1 Tax=Spirosoma luteum TaxID=431553 RepID=UPI00058B68DE|nr:GNAT family N-acetyltransferase [Spirosoma luteum]